MIEVLMALAIAALLVAVAVPGYRAFIDNARRQAAMTDLREIETRLARVRAERGQLPPALADIGWSKADPWGNAYQFLNFAGANRGQMRKDKNLNPVNTDYDLYSMGPDGRTTKQLNVGWGSDDIVRAADGRFVGVAMDF